MTKRCRQCGVDKPEDAVHFQKLTKGYRGVCRECRKQAANARRVQIVCPQCGETKSVSLYQLNQGQETCSPKCGRLLGWNWRSAAARNWEPRFWSKVDKADDCWIWRGHHGRFGYGLFTWAPSRGVSKVRAAHRVAYELLKGPIPDGLVLDHLCRNPPCVNPDHLEPVPQVVNMVRGFEATARDYFKMADDIRRQLAIRLAAEAKL